MKIFNKKIGEKGAEASYYIQEADSSVDKKRKSPFLIIVPGGAYCYTAWREREPIAYEFISKGFSCAIFDYATEGAEFFDGNHDYSRDPVSAFPNPLIDLAKLVADVRSHAEEWQLDPESINVIGFSAGGNLTAQLAAYWWTPWLAKLTGLKAEQMRPDSVALCYPAIKMVDLNNHNIAVLNKVKVSVDLINYAATGLDQSAERIAMINLDQAVTSQFPRTFMWGTTEDLNCHVGDAINFASDLAKNKVPFEFHMYQKGNHGMSLADKRTDGRPDHSLSDPQAASWTKLYLGWLSANNLYHLL